MKEFSKNLRALRIERGLSQRALGAVLGFTDVAVSHWEARNKEPSYDTLVKLARYFNVSTDFLLGLED